MVTCPNCGGDDLDLVERLPGETRRIRCNACGHDWVRGQARTPTPRSSPRSPPPGNPGKVITFAQDDEGYLEWTDRHPAGYVINTMRPPNPRYLVLHRATCYHITTPDHRFSSTSWTGNDYSKVCGPRRADLFAWTRRQFGSDPARCQHCDP